MINNDRLINNFMRLTAVEGVSRNESGIMNEIKNHLDHLGIECTQDNAGTKFDGNSGNLIARIPGTVRGDPFFFASHVDTISSSSGSPYIKDGVIYSDGKTVLGADDRAGVAAMLEAAEAVIEQNTDHPDIELLFLVGEEIGLYGSKYLDYSLVKSKFGFVLDSSADFGKIVTHAPTHLSCEIIIKGKASHGAIAPELGVHAIKIAAAGIHNTDVGRVSDQTTVSIGTIQGGTKTNVIPDKVEIKGEIRSLDDAEIPGFRKSYEDNFNRAAAHYGGEVLFEWKEEYAGFRLDEHHRIIHWITHAMRNAGKQPELIKFIGGSDANIFNQKGIPTVNLGLGYKKNHSSEEYMKLEDLTGIAGIVIEVINLSIQNL